MKNLIIIVFFCLCTSCSTESNETSENLNSKSIVTQERLILFEHSTEVQKYNEAFEAYLQKNRYPDSVEELSNLIQFIVDYNEVSNKGNFITPQQVLRIRSNPENEISTALENTLLGMEGRAKVESFIHDLINLQGRDYQEILDYIMYFEGETLKDKVLTDQEKESILAVSTLTIYSFQKEHKRKDKDWETSVGNRKVPSFFEPGQLSIIAIITLIPKII